MRETLDTWECRNCGQRPPVVSPYAQLRNGVEYFRPLCRGCDNANRNKYPRKAGTLDARAAHARRRALLRKSDDPKVLAKIILADTLRADRQKGRRTAVTEEWIAAHIGQPCFYCGEAASRRTLDRVDNDLGHSPENIVIACFRCNVVRGAMPYPAWLHIAPKMREAREQGLFGGWEGRTRGNAKRG